MQQQVDVPLVEPPRGTMTAPGAQAVTRGTLYDIDQRPPFERELTGRTVQ